MHLIDILNADLGNIVSNYYLIEDSEMSKYAKRMNSTKENAIILSGFPNDISLYDEKQDIDLLYLNCSFQYIFSTEKSVKKMREIHPKFICIDRALVGPIQTFYTIQKNVNYDIVAKFINENEFRNLFKENEYDIIYKYEREFNWDMNNFKNDMRLTKLPSYILMQNDQEKYKEQIKEYIDDYIRKGIVSFLKDIK